MALLDRIANYFKEWDGIDETAPKMELRIEELRYIANMNVERCRLIRQLNEANIKRQELRANVIDEFAERIKTICKKHQLGIDRKLLKPTYLNENGIWHSLIDDVVAQMKGEKE